MSSSNKKRIRSSFIYLCHSYIAVLFAIIQGIVLVPFYLKQIPADVYGYWLASGNIIAYFALLDLGLPSIFIQKTASQFNRNESGKLGITCGTCLIYGLAVAFAILVAGTVFVVTIDNWIKIDHNQIVLFKKSVMMAVISSAITIFSQFVGSLLLGLQESLSLTVTSMLSFVVSISATLLALSLKLGVMAIAIGFAAKSIVVLIGTGGSFLHIWRKISGESISFSLSDIKKMFRLSAISIIGKASTVISSHSDALLNSSVLNPVVAAVYSFNAKVKDVLFSIPDRISVAAIPTIANMQSDDDVKDKKKHPIIILVLSMEISLICAFGLFLFNGKFIELWIGKEMFGGQLLTGIICILFLVNVFRNALSNLIFSTGEIKVVNYCLLWEACLKVPVTIILMKCMGVIGLPVASIIVTLLICGISLIKKFKEIFKITESDVLKIIKEVAIYICVLVLLSSVFFKVNIVNSFFTLIITALVFLICCIISTLVLNRTIRKILLGWIINYKWMPGKQ